MPCLRRASLLGVLSVYGGRQRKVSSAHNSVSSLGLTAMYVTKKLRAHSESVAEWNGCIRKAVFRFFKLPTVTRGLE